MCVEGEGRGGREVGEKVDVWRVLSFQTLKCGGVEVLERELETPL